MTSSPAMHQLWRQTRTRKIPIIDHILTASSAGGEESDGGSSESREGDLRRALAGRAEEHIQIQNGKVERRDDEDASREGKRRVYAQAALWRRASDDEWDEWAVVDVVASTRQLLDVTVCDAESKKKYACPGLFFSRVSLFFTRSYLFFHICNI
ncbi:hypothetical protein M378DRAFT_162792, partial [Amanita muscaria Koide BX008]